MEPLVRTGYRTEGKRLFPGRHLLYQSSPASDCEGLRGSSDPVPAGTFRMKLIWIYLRGFTVDSSRGRQVFIIRSQGI